MVHLSSIAAPALLLPLTLACPLSTRDAPITVAPAQLIQIAPKSKQCDPTASFAKECVNATLAAPAISNSFKTYGITTPGAAAAVIGTMAFESGQFAYNIHHFPSPNPGQGTRNMQSAKYNQQYAQSIPKLKDQLSKAQGPDAILQLLNHYRDLDFGSAAWYLTTQCPSVKDQLATGSNEAFGSYVKCIGTEMSDDRTAFFTKALAALGEKH